MKRNIIMRTCAITATIAAIACSFALSLNAFADKTVVPGGGNSGDEGGYTGGGCAPSGTTGNYWDTCYGGAWIRYDADSDSIDIPKAGNVLGGTVEECQKWGGEFYRLGLVIYKPSTGQVSTSQKYGQQAGLTPVSNYKPSVGQAGGTGFTNYVDLSAQNPDALSWNEAYRKFQIAQEQGWMKTDWQDTSWFCYNPGWEKEDDPDPDPAPPAEAPGWSADVEITVSGRDGVEDHTVRSEKDLQAVIALSSDGPVTVTFTHKMYFKKSDHVWDANGNDEPDSVPPSCADWEVKTDNGSGGKGSVCADSKTGQPSEVTIHTETITVYPGDNVRNWACSQNDYGNHGSGENYGKTFSYVIDQQIPDKHCALCSWHYDRIWIYRTLGSGSGQAAACLSAVKPEDPTGQPVLTGSVTLPYIFAGETVETKWGKDEEISAFGWHERRIMAQQSPIYQVAASVGRYSGIADDVKREYTYRNDSDGTCSFWQSKQTWKRCENPVGYQNYGNSGKYDEVKTIQRNQSTFQVPDNVGDKFCTTYGYNWQYFWAYGTNFAVGSRPIRDQLTNWAWENGAKSRYWYIFGSSCRTIAKKPTTALWNGGLLTNGGVRTSVAYRQNNATFSAITDSDRTYYGSWTEYLGVVAGGVKGFGTGASYARGTSDGSDAAISPLTIANRSGLGGSGISTSNTFRTRLDTYLRTAAANNVSDMYNTSNTGTKITVLSGNQTITNNIEVNGNYNTIYQLPQNIIFVDGNLDIAPNVTRIDAWLIVNGELNTCKAFNSDRTMETAPGPISSNATCDKQLIFNGPVLAETLKLNRTYGADPLLQGEKYTPAEVFNLSADSYLWAYAQAGRYGSSYTESYSRELAPRY